MKQIKAVNQLLHKHPKLTHSEDVKVVSHTQRELEDWHLNTVMIKGCDAPFKFKRKHAYQNLKGARVNITYYPDAEKVANFDVEVMRVVRLKRA
ncbi:hypothetical protein [Motilimonas pumila]|uniref:Uncharacterized protein n=1 Tax=Motilimonas pumila TaxID=2303987 RepID=A0A418YFK0_9GAMM|nr:hypothetical protein [Motilimonas pumila]RJG48167.1 hypothetical protein D1Z90_08865 [Motilimonas pumila]